MNEYLSVYGTFFASQDTKSEERGEEGQEDYSGGVGRRRSSVFEQMKNIPTAGISSDSPRRPSLRRNSVSSENNQSQIDLGGSQVRTLSSLESQQILTVKQLQLSRGWDLVTITVTFC